MHNRKVLFVAFVGIFSCALALHSTTWTGQGKNNNFFDTNNWSNGLPFEEGIFAKTQDTHLIVDEFVNISRFIVDSDSSSITFRRGAYFENATFHAGKIVFQTDSVIKRLHISPTNNVDLHLDNTNLKIIKQFFIGKSNYKASFINPSNHASTITTASCCSVDLQDSITHFSVNLPLHSHGALKLHHNNIDGPFTWYNYGAFDIRIPTVGSLKHLAKSYIYSEGVIIVASPTNNTDNYHKTTTIYAQVENKGTAVLNIDTFIPSLGYQTSQYIVADPASITFYSPQALFRKNNMNISELSSLPILEFGPKSRVITSEQQNVIFEGNAVIRGDLSRANCVIQGSDANVTFSKKLPSQDDYDFDDASLARLLESPLVVKSLVIRNGANVTFDSEASITRLGADQHDNSTSTVYFLDSATIEDLSNEPSLDIQIFAEVNVVQARLKRGIEIHSDSGILAVRRHSKPVQSSSVVTESHLLVIALVASLCFIAVLVMLLLKAKKRETSMIKSLKKE